MRKAIEPHTFHIPVMGTGFTVDTPAKVAQYGISSVISIVDDMLIEKMREVYCRKCSLPFQPIPDTWEDHRAMRITAYLNLIDKVVKEKFDQVRQSVLEKGSELEKYIEMLPDFSSLKRKFNHFIKHNPITEELQKWVHQHLHPGSVDVNIMTKLDKENHHNDEKLPVQYNDAHAALRGFAMSTLRSSIVFSAGMNPRLYGYIEQFEDFYPDSNGELKKKIIIKVSDYRSARIQGQFLAKKGLWVSEYRIESGLNCGGHAFATDGYLLGPILEEFRTHRETLIRTTYETYVEALKKKGRPYPEKPFELRITAQGGVGTAEEHQFLLDHYQLDSVGWGSPFLLVPEVTNVDPLTRQQLCEAEEQDLYLSHISPLGVPFNSLRGNTKDVEKLDLVKKGRPGSSCPKQFLQFNREFTERSICVASRQYQKLKIDELDAKGLCKDEYQREFDRIVEKSCICAGLGTGAMLVNNVDTKTLGGNGVSICPGPNIAYFTEIVSLKEMVNHIYGRTNIIRRADRPNMFVKELKLYIDYLKDLINETTHPIDEKQQNYLMAFQNNLNDGIRYYRELFANLETKFEEMKTKILDDLEALQAELNTIGVAVPQLVNS